MQIHNAVITGSFSYNGADLSNVTSSNQSSASLSTRVTQIEQVYATTGSNSFRATQSITGSLTVTGQIIAQTLNVQQVTSSIVYSSGSNNFGCDINSRQTFTGSFYQTGSVANFSNCVIVGGALSGTSATFSGQACANNNLTAGGVIYGRTTNNFPTTGAGYYAIRTNNLDGERGGITLQVSCTTNTLVDALTINYLGAATFSSSVGVGGSPTGTYGTLSVFGGISTKDDNNGKLEIGRYSSGASNSYIKLGANSNSLRITNKNDTVDIFTIENGGNVGIGTVPSAWGTVFTKSAIQFGGSVGVGVLWTNSFNNGVFLGNNLYDDGAGNARYIINGASTQYIQAGGEHFWSNAASGTACNVATFTERMRITNCGNVLIGMSSSVSGRVTCIGLQVQNEVYSRGNSSGFFWEDRSTSANWGGWYTNAGLTYLYNGSGAVSSINMTSGVYTALSDVNKKKDFEQSTIGLDAVLNLKPTLYRLKSEDSSTEKHLGFIAQEVKNYIPQAYVESDGGMGDKFIGLNDRPILAAAIKAIQEQQCTINALKTCLGIS